VVHTAHQALRSSDWKHALLQVFGEGGRFVSRSSADISTVLTAAIAHALIRRAGQNPPYARKIRGQSLATRMLDGFLGRAMHWRVLALRLLDHFSDNRLEFE